MASGPPVNPSSRIVRRRSSTLVCCVCRVSSPERHPEPVPSRAAAVPATDGSRCRGGLCGQSRDAGGAVHPAFLPPSKAKSNFPPGFSMSQAGETARPAAASIEVMSCWRSDQRPEETRNSRRRRHASECDRESPPHGAPVRSWPPRGRSRQSRPLPANPPAGP